MIEFLKGKKTYILATLAGVVFVGQILGYIPDQLATELYTLLGISATVTLRAALSKTQ